MNIKYNEIYDNDKISLFQGNTTCNINLQLIIYFYYFFAECQLLVDIAYNDEVYTIHLKTK